MNKKFLYQLSKEAVVRLSPENSPPEKSKRVKINLFTNSSFANTETGLSKAIKRESYTAPLHKAGNIKIEVDKNTKRN